MNQKKHLAIAISMLTTLGLGATAHAADFTASATVENTVTVSVVNDFDLGTLFATTTGNTAAVGDGVGRVIISPSGVATDPAGDSDTVNLISLSTPTPAQGSVAVAADFSIALLNTSGIVAADFSDNTDSGSLTDITGDAIELVHESSNPAVPSLFLTHFTMGAVSGGTIGTETNQATPPVATPYGGRFPITLDFGATDFVFNIGGTVMTKPTSSAETYQSGVYSGSFTVTATY